MGELLELMSFIGHVFAVVFQCLDSVEFGGYSILDIFIALIFFDIVLWFIFRMLGYEFTREAATVGGPSDDREYEYEGAQRAYTRYKTGKIKRGR